MITSIEAINLLYKYLENSVLFTDNLKPTGQLYKISRPENSELEDVVINIVGGLTHDPVQRGVLVLNIYVKNLDPMIYPIAKGNNIPDTGRILYLTRLVKSLFTTDGSDESDLWVNSDTCFELANDDLFNDNNNQHYISFRINFFTIK